MSAINELPDYMKNIYRSVVDLYKEIEDKLSKEGRSYGVVYAKEDVCIVY